jgi:hypothetical protein
MTFIFAEPTELLLEITPSLQAQYWQQSQGYGTPSSRWCAYINQVCLNIFLDWVKTEYVPDATALPGVWELVNGSVIRIGEKRVVLIPSEAIDSQELEVPQEWVDIPNWAADYYLAVQVNPEVNWVRIWGYTTHQELKSRGNYDPGDRTYCLDKKQLTKDMSVFWMTYQFCSQETTKLALNPLPELSPTQAENLLQRFDTLVTFPRLAVPFTMWAALLENPQWQQRLCQQRQGISPQEETDLNQWIQGVYSRGWQAIETLMGLNYSNLAVNFRSASGTLESSIKQAKLIDLGVQIASQSVVLFVVLIPETEGQVSVCVQLHPTGEEIYLPTDIKLTLLSSGAILGEVRARMQDNYIQLPTFEVETGESFNIQIEIGNFAIAENFVI